MWIRADQGKPSYGERVLFSVKGAFVGEGYLGSDGVWYRMVEGYRIDEVLGSVDAWMPLPEPFDVGT